MRYLVNTVIPLTAFYSDFTGVGVTGLTVTIDIYSPSNTLVVSAGSCAELAGGGYGYNYTPTVTGRFWGKFKVTVTTVAQQELPFAFYADTATSETLEAHLDNIDTAIGSISVDLTPVTDALTLLDGKVDVIDGIVDTVDTNVDEILADTVILTGGAGSRAVTIQLYETSTTTPIVGVNVAAYNAGGDLMAQGTSTAAGQVLFALADGAHSIRMSKAGVVFDIETITVSGDGSFTLYGLPATIPAPSVPNYCVVYETITNTTTRTAPATVTATAKLTELPYDYNGQLFTGEIITGTYAAGIVSWQFPWGSQAVVSIDETNTLKEITVPSTANARISTL